MKDKERDLLRKIILQTCAAPIPPIHYTNLEKKIMATCQPWATRNTFKAQFEYLLCNGFVEKLSRGVYRTTEKGNKYFLLL